MKEKDEIIVVKVGGGVVEDSESLQNLLNDFSQLPGRKVLIHGGGRSATRIAAALGVESKMVDGRRVTDEEMLRIVTMVYGGLVNKTVVAGLQAQGVNALGLTGADMDVIRSHKRTGSKVDYGWVGDVDLVDGKMLSTLIEQGVVPVMAPLTHDGKGHMLNTNADTIASEVACALAEYYNVTLTFCFEKKGVLRDADDENSVIPHITSQEYKQLVEEGVISGGMIPKLDNSFNALSRGVKQVIITQASNLEGSEGTCIVK